MSKQGSPFAALTSRERQERWLEFQSVKLPYMQGNVDACKAAREASPAPEATARETEPQRCAPPARAAEQERELVMQQKAEHRQYDAILRRMEEANRQATRFQRWE